MSKIAIQIYEIQEPREAEAVVALGVDRIGSVILSEDEWKNPAIKDAVLVSREGEAKHSIIPLFNRKETLFRLISYYEPDVLHFCESLVYQNSYKMELERLVDLQGYIKESFPDLEIMRSVPVSTRSGAKEVRTLEIARCFEAVSDSFLTDTWLGKEPVEGFVGITGRTNDWDTARKLVESTSIPVIVAGGLSPQNVYDAVMATGGPQGVDSCTGTNKKNKNGKPERFRKDLRLVERFVEEVRRAEESL
jgi:phosphoribosylanthranilate isomerase